jgi:uncharacterized protein (DUF433 family)
MVLYNQSISTVAAGRKQMQLESYFDFVGEDAIRIAGTRIGIETAIDDYQQGAMPEEIVLRYPTLSLEQVYATITYYLANQQQVKSYIALVRQRQEDAWREQQANPSPFVHSLQERLAAQRHVLEQKGELPLVRVV